MISLADKPKACCRYEKYLAEKEPKKDAKSQDPFMDEYTSFVERINELNLVSLSRWNANHKKSSIGSSAPKIALMLAKACRKRKRLQMRRIVP